MNDLQGSESRRKIFRIQQLKISIGRLSEGDRPITSTLSCLESCHLATRPTTRTEVPTQATGTRSTGGGGVLGRSYLFLVVLFRCVLFGEGGIDSGRCTQSMTEVPSSTKIKTIQSTNLSGLVDLYKMNEVEN